MKTSQEITRTTGGYLNSVTLTDIPSVQSEFNGLLARVQSLPFVPSGWADDVRSIMAEAGSGTWQPRYAISPVAWGVNKTEPMLGDIPTWLSSDPNAAAAWNTLCDWWKTRLQPILAGWARSEVETLAAASDDAAFFDRLYLFVKPVAMVGDAILAAPEAIAGAASTVIMGTLKKFWPVLAVVAVIAVGVLVYKNKLVGKVGPLP